MFREKDLQACLYGIVGFRQNDNPEYEKLSPSLLESSSGLYIQDEHPLLCLENIDQALKNYDHWKFPAYSAVVTYAKFDRVRASDDKVYESLEDDNIANNPATSPGSWELVPLLSQKLEAVVKSSTVRLLNEVFTKKKLHGSTKSIVESAQFFAGSGNIMDKEVKLGRFVGFRISTTDERDLAAAVRRLGTQFTAVNPAFKLYVYHTSLEDPYRVYELNLDRVNSFKWSELKDVTRGEDLLTLTVTSDDHAPGGEFYIGYYEDDLIGQAINKSYRWDVAPSCGTCNNDLYYYQKWSPYFNVTPIAIPASALTGIKPSDPGGPKLFDVNYAQDTYSRNYGLNMDISVRCDVTPILCREKQILAGPILKQVAVDLIKILAYSTRNNVIAKEVRDLALFALQRKDSPGGGGGIVEDLAAAVKTVSFDFSDLSSMCLPCNDSGGPTYGTI